MDLHEMRYTPEHMWVRVDEDNLATIGFSEEILQEQGEIEDLSLPSEGEDFAKDEIIGKLSTDGPGGLKVYAPVSGEIVEINEDILDTPEAILEDPYEEGWLVRIEMANSAEFDDLMTRDEYEDFIGEDYPDDDDDEDIDDDLVDDEDEEF